MRCNDLGPIRLDIAFENQRFQDTFCWDPCESMQAAEQFAEHLCQDNDLPRALVPAIVTAIRQQAEACRDAHEAHDTDDPLEERNEIVRSAGPCG